MDNWVNRLVFLYLIFLPSSNATTFSHSYSCCLGSLFSQILVRRLILVGKSTSGKKKPLYDIFTKNPRKSPRKLVLCFLSKSWHRPNLNSQSLQMVSSMGTRHRSGKGIAPGRELLLLNKAPGRLILCDTRDATRYLLVLHGEGRQSMVYGLHSACSYSSGHRTVVLASSERKHIILLDTVWWTVKKMCVYLLEAWCDLGWMSIILVGTQEVMGSGLAHWMTSQWYVI